MSTKIYSVYVLECSRGKSLYTGIALNVEERVALHNQGKGAKYTRGRRPCVLLYEKEIGTRAEALRAEYAFKQLSRKEKLRIILPNTR